MLNIKDVYKYGFFSLIIAIIVILIFQGRSDGDHLYEDELQSRIETLDTDIGALSGENEVLRLEIGVHEDSLRILGMETEDLEYKRKAAIQYYEKRIRVIEHYSVTQLDSFFTARYPN